MKCRRLESQTGNSTESSVSCACLLPLLAHPVHMASPQPIEDADQTSYPMAETPEYGHGHGAIKMDKHPAYSAQKFKGRWLAMRMKHTDQQ